MRIKQMVAVAILLLLTACGQKGALVLKDASKPNPAKQPEKKMTPQITGSDKKTSEEQNL